MSEEKIVTDKAVFQITSENDFVDKLSSIKGDENNINHNLIIGDVKSNIQNLETEIKTFLSSNIEFDTYTSEDKDKLFDDVFTIYEKLKNTIKNANCIFNSTGIEIKTIDKKLHQSVEYTTETLFYGLHLKKNFLNDLPKVTNDFEMYDLTITFSNAIAMYHVLSGLTVKGLNKENYALAHILYNLTEISKLYQYYDAISERLHKSIMQWNLGLTHTDAKKLENAVVEEMLKDEAAKSDNA